MNPNKLRGLGVAGALKKHVEDLSQHPELSGPKEQEKIRDALYLAEKIHEFKIEEPRLLQMIFRKYGKISEQA